MMPPLLRFDTYRLRSAPPPLCMTYFMSIIAWLKMSIGYLRQRRLAGLSRTLADRWTEEEDEEVTTKKTSMTSRVLMYNF